jgi:hypothetical protein
MSAPTPLEVCAQIVAEHAANTKSAIEAERAARVATKLESYGEAVTQLAGELERDRISNSEEAAHG